MTVQPVRPPSRTSRPAHRRWFGLILLLIAVGLPLVFGELALRLIYRDGGRRTLGAPGHQEFEYRYRGGREEDRLPTVSGPKAPGAKRIVLFGDSITWGIGVYDWHRIYPERLLRALDSSQQHVEMQVYAHAGKNIDAHASVAEAVMPTIDADYVIYQWYSNDLEIDGQRDFNVRPFWRGWFGDDWLQAHSYLYQFLEGRAAQMVVIEGWGGHKPFLTWFREHYADGSPGWTRFADQFHRWATYATTYSPHVLVFLYPHVPFRDTYPLEDIDGRMLAMARPHALTYAAWGLRKEVGTNAPDASARNGQVRRSDGAAGVLVSGPSIPLAAGSHTVTYRVRLDAAPARSADIVAMLYIAAGNRLVTSRMLTEKDFPATNQWVEISVPFTLTDRLTTGVDWRVQVARDARLSVDTLSMPVAYPNLEVIDLRQRLNTYNAHVSLFDAHPNERAHADIADVLAEWIRGRP
jgi:hypothetical protein